MTNKFGDIRWKWLAEKGFNGFPKEVSHPQGM